MRGEYSPAGHYRVGRVELPPRARRIQTRVTRLTSVVGTTSACAENTRLAGVAFQIKGNYLRVRGEYLLRLARSRLVSELPPRARRIRMPCCMPSSHVGTTSACAENTHQLKTVQRRGRNYLRVRGEYMENGGQGVLIAELPPRARRIHLSNRFCIISPGTTSACAENTQWLILSKMLWRNYLRVRGEY